MKKTIKAFVGVIGSGKDYQCKLLLQKGYRQIAFADSLRELAWRIFKWQPNTNEDYEDFKKQIFGAAGYPFFTGREFLQRLGTDARDIISDDIWLNALKKKLDVSPETHFCISDLRFKNEFDFIKNLNNQGYNVEIIFTNYKSDRYDPTNQHESEYLAQYFLTNNKQDLQYLFKTLNKGDIVRINDKTGMNKEYIGSVAIIEDINSYEAYPYILDNGLRVLETEIDILTKYNP